MDSETMVKVICGGLAVLCVVIIIMRRKNTKKPADQDDF
jgi:hypothetical protein